MITKYAVLSRTARLQFVNETTELENTSLEMQNYTVAGGTLVKITQESQILANQSSPPPTVQVYVYDTVLREPDTRRTYQCTVDNLLPVCDNFWPFIVSIPEPQRRLQLLLHKDRCDWLSSANPGDVVSVPGRCLEQDGSKHYDCIVCYIGPVPEIHPVGYFFGLELLDNTPSPQKDELPFTGKYFECEAENAIFTTADRIIPMAPPQEEEPVAAENPNEAPASDWSIINFFTNTMVQIRASLPI
ncbi:uncharacterized protein LOC128856732 [Anastrepha ludens]|uniref:uncharacterized protein LOC128856732 n=1 Tax=Anastrepha ludens TaxID=28586 RepID=UPI0023B1320B|nr:uncharacterized protein LOC128856732 [Anastrepha ludens]